MKSIKQLETSVAGKDQRWEIYARSISFGPPWLNLKRFIAPYVNKTQNRNNSATPTISNTSSKNQDDCFFQLCYNWG